jgi:uncharacterized membrane protein (DUF485 family)
MIVITYDSVIDLLTGFLEQNARLIIGTIVNVFVIYVIFKLIDMFNKKFLKRSTLSPRESGKKENPLIVIVPVLL